MARATELSPAPSGRDAQMCLNDYMTGPRAESWVSGPVQGFRGFGV